MGYNIPDRLKEARKKLNLNQIEIAADLDIQQKSISDIENGKILNIPNTYIHYFHKKGISLNWIYDGSGSMLNSEKAQEETENKKVTDNLFDNLEKPEVLKTAGEKVVRHDKEELKTDLILYERIIDSKDYNIQSLLAYIKSLERNMEYLKNLLDKTLENKALKSGLP